MPLSALSQAYSTEADAGRTITSADLVDGVVKLSAGKKKIVLVKPV